MGTLTRDLGCVTLRAGREKIWGDETLKKGSLYQAGAIGVRITAYYRKNWDGYRMKPHAHPSMEIMYLASGIAGMDVNGSAFTMRAGDLILVDAGETHAICMQKGQRCRIINLEFCADPGRGSILYEGACSVSTPLAHFLSVPKPFFVLSHAQGIYHALQDVIFERDKDGDGVYQLAFWTLMSKIARLYEQANQKCSDQEGYVGQAIDYMYCHYDGGISISDLARHVCLSENYFQRLFREVTGRTPIEFLRGIRLEKAYALLQNTDIALKDIPDFIGIHSKQYFYQQFKKHFGQTPKEVRQTYKDVRIAE